VKKIGQIHQSQGHSPYYDFIENEQFPYLGTSYALKFDSTIRKVSIRDGSICLPESSRGKAQAVLQDWYLVEARRILTQMLSNQASTVGLWPKKVRISSARTRWGSCSSIGTISLCWRLIMAPPVVVEYVILHELIHLKTHNHSENFWQGVAEHMPEYKIQRAWLKLHGHTLAIQERS
jgi:predicted metal-dependent hydrolase